MAESWEHKPVNCRLSINTVSTEKERVMKVKHSDQTKRLSRKTSRETAEGQKILILDGFGRNPGREVPWLLKLFI